MCLIVLLQIPTSSYPAGLAYVTMAQADFHLFTNAAGTNCNDAITFAQITDGQASDPDDKEPGKASTRKVSSRSNFFKLGVTEKKTAHKCHPFYD